MGSLCGVMLLLLSFISAQLVYRDYGLAEAFNGGLITGAQSGGPFDQGEDALISGSERGGLISGGVSGGPFGSYKGKDGKDEPLSQPESGLISGSNTGGPFSTNNHQEGLISGGAGEGPFGSYHGKNTLVAETGKGGPFSQPENSLISGSNTGGPFATGNQQGGIISGGPRYGPCGSYTGKDGEPFSQCGSGLHSGSNSGGTTGGPFGTGYLDSASNPFLSSNYKDGLISGGNNGGPLERNHGKDGLRVGTVKNVDFRVNNLNIWITEQNRRRHNPEVLYKIL